LHKRVDCWAPTVHGTDSLGQNGEGGRKKKRCEITKKILKVVNLNMQVKNLENVVVSGGGRKQCPSKNSPTERSGKEGAGGVMWFRNLDKGEPPPQPKKDGKR